MRYFLIKSQIVLVVVVTTLIPLTTLAQTNNRFCSSTGYTVATINGVFTDEDGAIKNRDNLKRILPDTHSNEPLTIDYLLNPSHLGGLGDIAVAVYQKVFDSSKVEDYDLVEMLKTASEQVRTQKLLLVAHSQGNFYANSFYDVVADKVGGVPKESIGVYGVATPASRVAGDGKWLTSDTDTIIAGIAARTPFKNIMTSNTHIELQSGDDSLGHSFSDVYLKYRGGRIISDIQASLNKLSENNIQDGQKLCIDPPELTLAHKAMGAVLAVADPIAGAGGNAVVGANKFIANLGERVTDGSGSMLAQVSETVGDFFSKFLRKEADTSGLALVAEIPLNNNNGDGVSVQNAAVGADGENNSDRADKIDGTILADNQDEDVAERVARQSLTNDQRSATLNSAAATAQTVSVSIGAAGAGQGEATFPVCKYETVQSPNHQKFLINEVAWMGGTASANDEWIEVKNISGGQLDISGWQILDKSEQIKITFPAGTKLGAGAFLLLERTDDDSVPGVVADAIYAGALSNTDEGLRLFDKNCALVDEAMANLDWPAGESTARKTMERSSDLSWHTYSGNGENNIFGTPKKENSFVVSSEMDSGSSGGTSSTPTPSVSDGTSHLVISEVQITGGTGQTTNDFIELYNPTDSSINLNGYRLVKRTKTGTTDTSIKSWTSDAFVPAKGFYLWANSNYVSIAVTPDATTTATIADDNAVALRQGAIDTGTIIDSVGWGEAQNVFLEGTVFASNPGANQSLERKAYSGGCVSASGSGEYLGNGCDTNSNSSDFEIRATSNPQNSHSFPEPRNAPTAIQTLNASFSSSTMELILNWSESQDYAATSTITYFLRYATSTNSLKDLAALSATSSYKFVGEELGTTYLFSITPRDRDGLTGSTTSKNLSVTSPLTNLYFYKDTRSTTSQKYLLDFSYVNYPFVPDIYQNGAQSTWKILVFYLNQEAPAELELNAANNWQSSVINGVLQIKYPSCAGGNPERYSLILPDTAARCSNGGGVENSALQFSNLEDPHLLLELATTTDGVTFTNSDFVAVGLYSFYQSGGGDQKFKLAALDRTKYYFQASAPTHQAPIFNGSLEINFDASQSELNLNWQNASDSDTLENLINYEINYSTTTELADWAWQNNSSSITANKAVSAGDSFLIGVRAKDDFGNYSSVATTSWSYPPTTFYISQTEANGWSSSFGVKNPNCPSCPDTASLQSLEVVGDFDFNTVVLRLKQETVSDTADVRLSIYPDNGGLPDFDFLLAEKTILNLINPDSGADLSFNFDEAVSLSDGEIYWLVLDVKNYSSGNTGFFRNQWQNAINTGTDLYDGGQAGKGNSGLCDSYCDFTIPYPDSFSDWYFKIGLAP
ncbi:MAG: lamin tail domain-containing protein [Candidatus Harrisonbacteria bacterium]|nr:lamin tail domain-containing protein [Candidatus Harrisonbacteria bacterium]